MFTFSHCFESKTAKRTIFRHGQQRKGSNCTHLNAWIKICIIYPTSLLAWCVDESWRQNKFSLSIMIFLVIFHRCCNIIWTSMPPIVFLYQPRRFACPGTSSNHVKLSRTMQTAFTIETAAPHWLLPLLLWEGSFQRMIFLLSRVNFAHVLGNFLKIQGN